MLIKKKDHVSHRSMISGIILLLKCYCLEQNCTLMDHYVYIYKVERTSEFAFQVTNISREVILFYFLIAIIVFSDRLLDVTARKERLNVCGLGSRRHAGVLQTSSTSRRLPGIDNHSPNTGRRN